MKRLGIDVPFRGSCGGQRRFVWLVFLLVACRANTPNLEVLRVDPHQDALDVDPATSITIEFTAPVDPVSLNRSTVRLLQQGREVPVKLDHQNQVLTVAPAGALALGAVYTVMLDRAIRDVKGRPLASSRNLTFTTRDGVWREPRQVAVGGVRGIPQVAWNKHGAAVVGLIANEFADGSSPRGRPVAVMYLPGRGWSQATLAESEGTQLAAPSVGIDDDGNACAAWADQSRVYFSRYIAALERWEPAKLIGGNRANGAFNTEGTTRVAVTRKDACRAIWVSAIGSTTSGRTRVSSYEAEFSGSTSTVVISISPLAWSVGSPIMAAAPELGEHVVVWENQPLDEKRGVAAVVGGPHGYGEVTMLGSEGGRPRVAMDQRGHAVAVWPSLNRGLATARMRRGEKWGQPSFISGGRGPTTAADIRTDSRGNFIAVWVEHEQGKLVPHAARASDSGVWSTPVALSAGGVSEVPPGITLDETGNGWAVWFERNDDINEIWAARYLAADDSWRTPKLIARRTEPSPSRPSVVLDSGGRGFAVWGEQDGIFMQRFDLADTVRQESESVQLGKPGGPIAQCDPVAPRSCGLDPLLVCRPYCGGQHAGSASCSSTMGTRHAGESCQSAWDCASGHCQFEPCPDGTEIGYCTSYCNTDADCGEGALCRVSQLCRPFRYCSQSCNPIAIPSGCPAGLTCAENSRCVCRAGGSSGRDGAPCEGTQDCAEGFSCALDEARRQCRPTCKLGGNDCGADRACVGQVYTAVLYGACVKSANPICDPFAPGSCGAGQACRATCPDVDAPDFTCQNTSGNGKVGEACASPRDCVEGTDCNLQSCAGGIEYGECLPYCRTSAECGPNGQCLGPLRCGAAGSVGVGVCIDRCDPIAPTAGCRDGFRCWLGDDDITACLCAGTFTGAEGASCRSGRRCQPGQTCVKRGTSDDFVCRRICRPGGSDCPEDRTCTILPGHQMYGACL